MQFRGGSKEFLKVLDFLPERHQSDLFLSSSGDGGY